MMVRFAKLVCFIAVVGVTATVRGQGSGTLTLVAVSPTSTTIEQGQEITFEVRVQVSGVLLRGYQATLDITGGTAGSLTLADPTNPPPNTALFIDELHSNYVFLGRSAFPSVNVGNLAIASALQSSTSGVAAATPKYCGTYRFRASSNALGTFSITFSEVNGGGPTSTYLRAPGATLPPIPIASAIGATVTVIPPIIEPPNDTCGTSEPIFNGATPFDNLDGVTEPGTPALPGTCDEGAGLSFGRDIWYDYTATCTGIVTVSTCSTANFDTRLAVYDGPGNSCNHYCPTDNTGFVTCDDNTPGCTGNTAEAVFSAVSGNCYTIRLGGLGTAQGSGTLTVTCTANDSCANATFLTPPTTTLGSTRNTNVDSGLPSCGPSVVSPGVWYRVVGDGNLLTASLCTGTLFNTRLTVFTGPNCSGLACLAGADNNCSNQESLSWCSTSGTQYWILVHGGAGASGQFTLNVSSTNCNDNNACTTNDSCSLNACVYTNTTPAGSCCSPTTGNLTPINDLNPCTTDICNANGTVSHPPGPNGPNVACADDLRCTLDQCASGLCANTDINTLSCVNDSQCPGGNQCESNMCFCIEDPTLELVPNPGTLPVASCYSLGNTITVRIEMGFAPQPIVGGQAFLSYDPITLKYLGMAPGRTVDPQSPFTFQLREIVNEVAGTIDYAAAIEPGGVGTATPATFAVITFEAVGECDPFLRFRAHSPPTELVDASSNVYSPILTDLPAIRVNGSPPSVAACPADVSVNFDPGLYSGAVTWPVPTASDSCDGVLPVTCVSPPGTAFAEGTTQVTCTTVNSCGVADACSFDVTVVPSVLTVDLEMSPVSALGLRTRCVTFELYNCGTGMERTVNHDIALSAGRASSVSVTVPGGEWDCVVARDKLHTLRSQSTDLSSFDFVDYSATFMGDPDLGGKWLIGGNLNDDNRVDIQDYVRFLQQYLMPLTPGTPCGTLPYHADINGNGVVDAADLSFIQLAFFMQSDASCCATSAATWAEPDRAVSIQQLRRKGLGHLSAGDLNSDGMLDETDMRMFIENPPVRTPIEGPLRGKLAPVSDLGQAPPRDSDD